MKVTVVPRLSCSFDTDTDTDTDPDGEMYRGKAWHLGWNRHTLRENRDFRPVACDCLTPEALRDLAPVDDPVEDGGGAWGDEIPGI